MNRIAAHPPTTTDALRHLYPVVLCGGAGKRLWPVSRQSCPKQFQRLFSERSLLQETVLRVAEGFGPNPPLVLCSDEHRFLAAEHLDEIGTVPLAILCEPIPRNTAPALTAAAMALHALDRDAVMLAMPADHLIADRAAFADAVARAAAAARSGWLTTFGIQPDRPETGYGYIRQGDPLGTSAGVHRLARFLEKPDAAQAARLIAEGGHLWNSGIFLLPTEAFLGEVRRLRPDLAAACAGALETCDLGGDRPLLDEEAFAGAPEISLDYAVMEHTERAAVVPVDMGWSDIGSWHALRDVQAHDGNGNVLHGNVLADDVSNTYIHANGRLVAALGVDDLVIVDTDDAVLVSTAGHAAGVDRLVRSLGAAGASEASAHARVPRPWGHFRTVERGERFQVKHILVKPGQQLSLQMHHHRAEHWIVVAGTARVTRGDEVRLIGENEAIHIPLGTSHRLENPGKIPLHLIEVQVGSYLGEDDIVRIDDIYGRI